jgi:hypothetical protein
VLGDGFSDAANDFSLRLARCPRGLFPFPHLSDADYWDRYGENVSSFGWRERRNAGSGVDVNQAQQAIFFVGFPRAATLYF